MAAAGIYAHESAFLDCYVQLGVAGDRVVSVSFPEEPPEDARDDHPLFDRVDAYLDGAADDFDDVAVGLTVPTDQRGVLEAVRSVPYGDRITVDTLLTMVPGRDPDSEEDRQLARTALAENPVPLFVPDHRVRNAPSGAPDRVLRRLRDLES
ncbi:MGMT family protein [Halobacterium wangiae]|uniref:MGMT family protein n=1 Tax=Halobacterium wangiae TaxID=2902623 RepID=UPI001E57F911|nr:MGMT family protein [Halobacterium wangiae]